MITATTIMTIIMTIIMTTIMTTITTTMGARIRSTATEPLNLAIHPKMTIVRPGIPIITRTVAIARPCQ
jgi:hypothetical protein